MLWKQEATIVDGEGKVDRRQSTLSFPNSILDLPCSRG